MRRYLLCLCVAANLAACGDDGDDGPGTEADRLGVGAACDSDNDCVEGSRCLTQFKGGYCGLENCASDADCPQGSACVIHVGGQFCFRTCTDKPECNLNRPPDLESNCGSSIEFVGDKAGRKACVPPSG
ncbi:MAG: hypothetical protein JW940_06790 [Polyangiaceae bacterium]|nr:hypothetical protein [Polyangiaceae bacterium]